MLRFLESALCFLCASLIAHRYLTYLVTPFLFRVLTNLSPAGRALRVFFSNALITCRQPARRKPHQHHPSSKRRNQCVTTNKLWTAGPTSAFQLLRVSFGHRHRLPLFK